MSAAEQACHTCDGTFAGTRLEARRARWEPYSNATQAQIDRGPLVCPDCVASTLDALLEAMLTHARREPAVTPAGNVAVEGRS